MIRLRDICSLTDFQRKAKEHIKRLKRTGRPEVLTVQGKAEIVVQDAEAYEKLLDQVDRAEAIESIQRGLDSVARGEGRPISEALESIRKKHDISCQDD